MTTIYKPFYIPKECLGYVFKTNFHQEFDDADHEGVEAVKETYQRICNKNKDNIGILGELQIVLNSRLCFWEQKLNKLDDSQKEYFSSIADTYFDLFYLILEIVDKDKILKQEPENPKPVEFLRIYLELFYKTHHYLTRQNFYGKRENWQIIE